jgi:hypothetical protein
LRERLTWSGWQRFAGWSAVIAFGAWISKFILYSAIGGYQETAYAFLTGPLPTVAAVAGLVAMLGIVAPLVANRGRAVRLIASIGGGLAATLVLGAIQNTVQDWPVIVSTEDPINAQNLFGALYSLLIAFWLLRPRATPGVAVLAALGGLAWTFNAVMVARGASIDGWVVVLYQVGLFSLLVAASWAGARLIRGGHYLAVIGGAIVMVALLSLPNVIPVGHNAWIAIMGLGTALFGVRTLFLTGRATPTQGSV